MNKMLSWFENTIAGDTPNAAAERAGLVGSTLSRQIKAGVLSPESIVAIARAYDADPIEGLIIAGLITEADVTRHGADVLLETLTDKMLADEVWNRMQAGKAGVEITGGQPTLASVPDISPSKDAEAWAANNPGYDPDLETDQ